jgi:hypothetical protein
MATLTIDLPSIIRDQVGKHHGAALGDYLEVLTTESGRSRSEVKEAVVELLNEGDLILTADRKLELSAQAAQAAPHLLVAAR